MIRSVGAFSGPVAIALVLSVVAVGCKKKDLSQQKAFSTVDKVILYEVIAQSSSTENALSEEGQSSAIGLDSIEVCYFKTPPYGQPNPTSEDNILVTDGAAVSLEDATDIALRVTKSTEAEEKLSAAIGRAQEKLLAQNQSQTQNQNQTLALVAAGPVALKAVRLLSSTTMGKQSLKTMMNFSFNISKHLRSVPGLKWSKNHTAIRKSFTAARLASRNPVTFREAAKRLPGSGLFSGASGFLRGSWDNLLGVKNMIPFNAMQRVLTPIAVVLPFLSILKPSSSASPDGLNLNGGSPSDNLDAEAQQLENDFTADPEATIERLGAPLSDPANERDILDSMNLAASLIELTEQELQNSKVGVSSIEMENLSAALKQKSQQDASIQGKINCNAVRTNLKQDGSNSSNNPPLQQ